MKPERAVPPDFELLSQLFRDGSYVPDLPRRRLALLRLDLVRRVSRTRSEESDAVKKANRTARGVA